MNAVTLIMLVFALIGAADRLIGCRFGIGKEFERGFNMLGTLSLSMIGMICISPLIADLLEPMFTLVYDTLGIDPSIIPASLFANDMGGAPLALEVARNETFGGFAALVVSSMMGCFVSFTIPFALGTVKAEHHRELLLGLLCGVVTVPVGCFVGGIVCGIGAVTLLLNLLPLILFSAVIALGLVFCPSVCVKIFSVFGKVMTVVITLGLALGIVTYLTGFELVSGLAPLEEGAGIVFNICVILAGAFPLMYVIRRLLARPLERFGGMLGIDSTAATGLLSTLVTSAPTFEMMNTMDKKGIVLNAALATSAAFVFGDHLAFTLAFDEAYILPMIVGKLTAGVSAVVVAVVIYARTEKKEKQP